MLTWVDGEDAETLLPMLSETEQYVLGLKSGEILRKIHSIPMPDSVGLEDWETHYNRKLDRRHEEYRKSKLHFDGDHAVISYIDDNRHLLCNRPQVLQHGDYHAGNIIIDSDKNLYIIDFNRFDIGDPWEEFSSIYWTVQASPYFATGQIKGYFDGNVPNDFLDLLCFYNISCLTSNLTWSIPFGQQTIDDSIIQNENTLNWYKDFTSNIPAWYLEDFYIQYVDGIPFKLKSPFDFSFLSKYGKIFKVFDDQDGGNVCFGTEKNGERYFVKFAGAPQARYEGEIKDAISRLKSSVQVYQDLGEHPILIRFIKAEGIGGGFVVIFEWTDALGMGRMYPLNHKRFMVLPIETRKSVFEDILRFHEFVCGQGYVAIDFYDGSIMYDFENEKTVICDIDFYQKIPYRGEMGLWGSSRFVSPEECKKGEIIDEMTTVYTMGATAFCLFTDSDRSPEAWPLDMKLYEVVKKAVSDDRNGRQRLIRQLIEEWEAAK